MGGNIYFLTDGDLIKVGYARVVTERIEAIQCGNGRKITCLCSAPGTIKMEKTIHGILAGRMVGEWFKPTDKLLRLLRQIIITPIAKRDNCIPDFISREQAKARRRNAASKLRGERMAARLRAETQALITELAGQYGAAQVAKAIGFSEGSVRFWMKGNVMPSALAFVRLGTYFPDRIVGLHRPLAAPIARAERLGIAA